MEVMTLTRPGRAAGQRWSTADNIETGSGELMDERVSCTLSNDARLGLGSLFYTHASNTLGTRAADTETKEHASLGRWALGRLECSSTHRLDPSDI